MHANRYQYMNNINRLDNFFFYSCRFFPVTLIILPHRKLQTLDDNDDSSNSNIVIHAYINACWEMSTKDGLNIHICFYSSTYLSLEKKVSHFCLVYGFFTSPIMMIIESAKNEIELSSFLLCYTWMLMIKPSWEKNSSRYYSLLSVLLEQIDMCSQGN